MLRAFNEITVALLIYNMYKISEIKYIIYNVNSKLEKLINISYKYFFIFFRLKQQIRANEKSIQSEPRTTRTHDHVKRCLKKPSKSCYEENVINQATPVYPSNNSALCSWSWKDASTNPWKWRR